MYSLLIEWNERAKDSYPWLMSRCYGGNFPFIEMQDLARSVARNSSLDYLCAVRLGLSLDKTLQCDTACFVVKTAPQPTTCALRFLQSANEFTRAFPVSSMLWSLQAATGNCDPCRIPTYSTRPWMHGFCLPFWAIFCSKTVAWKLGLQRNRMLLSD